MDGHFKQTILGFNIAIEKSTSSVPRDGRYHVIFKNNIVYSTKVLKLAQSKFNSLLKEMGYALNRMEEKLIAEDVKDVLHKQRVDQLSRAYDSFWDNSYKFRKGGRLNKR